MDEISFPISRVFQLLSEAAKIIMVDPVAVDGINSQTFI